LNVKQTSRNQWERNREEPNREKQVENITEFKEGKQKKEVARTKDNDRTGEESRIVGESGQVKESKATQNKEESGKGPRKANWQKRSKAKYREINM
jgi:hypothetical protein